MQENYHNNFDFPTEASAAPTEENTEPLFLTNYKYARIEVESLSREKRKMENTSEEEITNLSQREDHHQIAIADMASAASTIPISLKILFSLPSFSKMSCMLVLNVYALIFYESKGSSLLLISFFTAMARCIELLIKPVVAHISDNCISSMGRRKPFMLFGCAFYSIFLVLLFSPPHSQMTPVSTSLWFGLCYVMFFIADTVVNIPYHALGPELSTNSLEREKLYLMYYLFQYVGVLFTSIAPVLIQKYIKICDCGHCDFPWTVFNKAECINECLSRCSVNSNEKSLLYLCMFLGILFVISITLLSVYIREKRAINNKEDGESYIIPTLYRLLQNKPFLALLTPYIIDTTISQIFATMLPFFISVVTNPTGYCRDTHIDLNFQYCNPNSWLGITIFSFFLFSIGSILVWHVFVPLTGKAKAWQSYSLMNVLTFSLFLFCDAGMMSWLVIFSIINALPAGGLYLNDVILSDIIDYDEFSTGKRNEGIYMVFTTFAPKIVGIVAQSIPLTVMSLIGFIPSTNGIVHDQPRAVVEFIRVYFIAVPVILSLTSFYFKLRYPIDSETKMEKLSHAISLQNSKVKDLKSEVDFYYIKNPIYLTPHIQIFPKTEMQIKSKIVADHFHNIEYLTMLSKHDCFGVKSSLFKYFIFWSLEIFVFLVILFFTFKYLEFKSLSLFPLFSLILATIGISMVILNILQIRMINKCISGENSLDWNFVSLCLYQLRNNEIEGVAKK